MSDEGEKLDVIAKRLDGSMGDLTKGLNLVDRASFDGLVEEYKKADGETKKLILSNLRLKVTMLEIDSVDFLAGFRKSLKTAVTEVGVFTRMWQQFQISIDKSKAAEAAGSTSLTAGNNIGLDSTLLLTKQFGISEESLRLIESTKDAYNAGTIGAAGYLDVINQVAAGTTKMNESFRNFIQTEREALARVLQTTAARKEAAELLDRLNAGDTTTTRDLARGAADATRELDAYLKLINNLTTKQEQLRAQSTLLTEQQKGYLQVFKDLTASQKERIAYDRDIADGILKHNELQQAAVRHLLDSNAAIEKSNLLKQEAAKLASKEPLALAQDEYNRSLEKANLFFQAGATSAAEYAAQVDLAALKLANATPMIVGLSGAFQSFISGVVLGGQSFGDAFAGMAKSIANLVVQILVIEPLIRSLRIAMAGMSIFGGGTTAGGAGAVAYPIRSALGNSFNSGTGLPHGVYNSPTLFKFANGGMFGSRTGLLGEAGPEAILPLRRNSQGKLGVESTGANVNVEINNYSSSEVSTESQTNSDGSTTIKVFIEKQVKDMFAGGGMDRTMRGAYGLTRVGA
jgi:lambda family phage tail tape measure protein